VKKRPRTRRARPCSPVVLLSAIILSLSFSGCVDLKADAAIASDGSGPLSVDYRVPKTLEPLDRYQGESFSLPFPLNRSVLDRRALSSPGIALSRCTREDTDGEIRISTEIRFRDLPSLARFLDPGGGRILYAAADGQRELRITLSPDAAAQPDAASWAGLLYPDYAVSLSVSLPSQAVSVSPGTLSASGTAAAFAAPTTDLLARPDLLVWTIRW